MSAYILNRFHISAILMFTCTGKPDATTYLILADPGKCLCSKRSFSAHFKKSAQGRFFWGITVNFLVNFSVSTLGVRKLP